MFYGTLNAIAGLYYGWLAVVSVGGCYASFPFPGATNGVTFKRRELVWSARDLCPHGGHNLQAIAFHEML